MSPLQPPRGRPPRGGHPERGRGCDGRRARALARTDPDHAQLFERVKGLRVDEWF